MAAFAKEEVYNDNNYTKRKIGPDDRVHLDGRILEYDGDCKDGIYLKSVDEGRRIYDSYTYRDIARLRSERRLEIEYDYHTKRNALARREKFSQVTSLSPDVIMRAKMIAEFLEAEEGISELGFSVARSPKKIALFIARFAAENEALVEQVRQWRYENKKARKNPFVGPRQFQRLVEQFEEGELDPASLEPRYQGRTSSDSKFTPEARAFAFKYMEQFHTEDERPLEFVWELMKADNDALPPEKRHAELPSVTTMWRMKQEAGDFYNEGTRGHDKYRIGRDYALSGKGLQPERPLEIVEMDCHRINLVTVLTKNRIWKYLHDDVRKEIKKEKYRGWLSVAFDAFSRSVCGMKFLFKAPDTESSIATLAMVAQDKTHLSAITGAKSRWDQCGTAEAVHTDAGSEYVGAEFQAVAMMFTRRHTIPPAKHPHLRARVERFFRTINQKYIHLFPGQTFSSILLKDQYDSEKFARLTHEQVADLLVRLIVDCYHNTYHRGIGMTPLQKWYRGSQMAKGAVRDIPTPAQYTAIFGSTLEYKIGKYGIEVAGNRYRSPELLSLKLQWRNRKFIVRVNDQDLSAIAVKHPLNNTWLSVPAVFDGLKHVTLQEWEMVVSYLYKKYGKKLDHTQPVVRETIRVAREMIAKTGESPNVIRHTSPKDVIAGLEANFAAVFSYTQRQDYDDGSWQEIDDDEDDDTEAATQHDVELTSDNVDDDADDVDDDDDATSSSSNDENVVYDRSRFLSPEERRSAPGKVGKTPKGLPSAKTAPAAKSKVASPPSNGPIQAEEPPKKNRQRFESKYRNDSE